MKVLVGVTLVFVLGTMFVSLFHMSTGMDMTGGMADCPFMAHEEVICPMDLADHIGAWKAVFLAVAPANALMLLAASVIVAAVSIAPHLFAPRRPGSQMLPTQLRERTYTFSVRPLQELFSNGILHPKLF